MHRRAPLGFSEGRPSRATPYSHKYHRYADLAILNGVFSSPYLFTDPEEQIWVHPASRGFAPVPDPFWQGDEREVLRRKQENPAGGNWAGTARIASGIRQDA